MENRIINPILLDGLKSYITKYYKDPNKKTTKIPEVCGVDVIKHCVNSAFNKYGPDKKELEKEKEITWVEQLFEYIDERELSDVEAYKRSCVSKQTFHKIKSNTFYQPTKETVIQFCFGLKLTVEESKKFLSKAGFSLSNSNTRDLAIRYFLKNRLYDVKSLDMYLDEIEEKLILHY